MLSRSEFGKCMARLQGFFNKTLSEQQTEIWFDMLSRWDDNALFLAVKDAISNERAFPTPKALGDYCREHRKKEVADKKNTYDISSSAEKCTKSGCHRPWVFTETTMYESGKGIPAWCSIHRPD